MFRRPGVIFRELLQQRCMSHSANLCMNKLKTTKKKHILSGWIINLCYSNSLKMAPGCHNVLDFYMCYVYFNHAVPLL